MKKNKNSRWLFLILCFGFSAQMLFLFFFINPYVLEWPDPNHYLRIANALANGDSYSSDIYNLYRSPGYPYFLYLIIVFTGNNLLLIRLIHVALYIVFLIGVYYLGKEWKGQSYGLLLTFVCVLYPYYIYIPLTLYPEALLIFISSWIVYLFLRIDRYSNNIDLAIASLIISVGVLTRPTYIIASIAFFAYISIFRTSISNKIKVFIFLIIIPFSFLSLWGYRNLQIHNHFIISTAGSINLYKGFNENTTIYTKSDCPIPIDVQNKLSLAKDDFEKDSIYKKSAIDYIKQNPLRSMYLASVRMLDLWNPIPHTTTNYSLTKKILSSIPYAIVLFLSFFGFYLLRKEKFVYLLIGIVLLNTGANGIFAVSIRYRVIFDIVIIMLFTYYIFKIVPFYLNKSNNKWIRYFLSD